MTEPDDTPDDRAERIAASVRRQIEAATSSRRGFIGRSLVAGGALLALGSTTGLAEEHEEEEEDEEDEELSEMFDNIQGTDIDVLNYALGLERLKAAFYREALDEFDEGDFTDSDALSEFDEEDREEIYGFVQMIAEHGESYVELLYDAVTLLGGTPESEPEYEFEIESVEDVLSIAQTLENTAVGAYAGAAPFVESPDLLGAALSIHSVTARHAAILNHVNGESPFPDAFDAALSQEEVLDAIAPFVEEDEEDEEDEEEEEEEEEDE